MTLIPMVLFPIVGCFVTWLVARCYYHKQQRKNDEHHRELLAIVKWQLGDLKFLAQKLAAAKGAAAGKEFQVAMKSHIQQGQTPQSFVASTGFLFRSLDQHYPGMYNQWEDVRRKACASAPVVDTSVDPNGPYSPWGAHGT